MRLGAVKRHWERLGRRDPFWAVLTRRDIPRDGWDLEQFFQSGVEEIAAVLQRADRLNLAVARRRALDFGCGVGRLTQPMADHFGRCDGVDISSVMLREARRRNRHPDRCVYRLNRAPDLALFADASFDFVYSTLVLQHMEPRYSKGYIRQLVRVLAPNGLLVFQLPSHRTAQEPPRSAPRTSVPGRLPASACRARLSTPQSSVTARAGEQVTLHVTVENCSPLNWPSQPDARGRFTVNLGNHWLDEHSVQLQRDDARCPLPHDLEPGSRADLLIGVTAPDANGEYWLELDLVQENAGWFAERGSDPLRLRCHVSGGLPGASRPSPPVSLPPPCDPPFRERHPRVFNVLLATGLRDLYWVWRHAKDRVKARRDRAIWWMKARAYEPVVPPLINWWNGRPFEPRMEMHCVARAEVAAVVAESGGRLVETDEELMPGGFQSCRYWVTKDGADR